MRELEIYQKHFEGTNFAHTQDGILVFYLLRDGLVKNLRVRVKEPVTDDTEFQVTLNDVVMGTVTIETGNYSSSTLDVDVAGVLFDVVVLNLTEVGTGEVISPIVLQVEVDENAVYPAKTKPIDADKVLVSDSEASNATKELDLENLRPLMQARTPDPTPVPIGGDGTVDLTGKPKSDIIVSGDGNIDTILLEQGETKTVTFSGVPLITYDASDLPITGNKDIQIVAGDKIQVVGGDDDIAYIEKHLPYSQQSVPRVTEVVASDFSGTITPNLDTTDILVIGVDENVTIAAPIGTPRNRHQFKIYMTGPLFGPAKSITWNAIYREVGCELASGTDGVHILVTYLSYNEPVSKWDAEYTAQQGTTWQAAVDGINATLTDVVTKYPYPLEVLMIPLSDLTSVLPDTALSSVQYGAVYFPMPYNFRILTTDVESGLRGLRLFANPNIPPPTTDVVIRVFVGGDDFTDAVHPISLPSGELDDDGTVEIATGTHDFNEGDIITAEYMTDGGTAGAGHILMLRGRRLP